MVKAYYILIAGWAIYFLLHSILASNTVKKYLPQGKKGGVNYYRIIYNIIATIGLFALLLWNASIQSEKIFQPSYWSRYASLVVATPAVFILKAAFRQYSLGGFLGFSYDSHETFKAGGILRHIRHPIYAATILLVAGFWLFVPNYPTLVSVICVFIYLPIGIYMEEKKLVKHFGEAYLKYRDNVPSLIPKIRI